MVHLERHQLPMGSTVKLTSSQPRTYNAPLDTAVGADNLIPHDVPLSAVEILTYFPHHLKWPDVMFRLFRGGFRGPQMAKVCLVHGILLEIRTDQCADHTPRTRQPHER